MCVTENMTVADVLDGNDDLLEVFVSFGFKELTNPVMRKLMAGKVTIEAVCKRKNVNLEDFLEALNNKA